MALCDLDVLTLDADYFPHSPCFDNIDLPCEAEKHLLDMSILPNGDTDESEHENEELISTQM